MYLFRHGAPGKEAPGIIDQHGKQRDLSGVIDDFTPEAFADGVVERVRRLAPTDLPLVPEGARLGACLARPSKVVCVGLNYVDHAREANMELPTEPILFLKAPSALCGPNDDILLPLGAEKVDWEVELGVVIGHRASFVDAEDALKYVAGYCVVNDVSERSHQLERNGQWTKGKSADNFCPVGPWLVTADEVADPQNLTMRLEVDGRIYQDSSTAQMVFGVAELVAYISQFMTLLPGDLIATGTPAGVGMGQRPQTYLKEGNIVLATIQMLGEQRQTAKRKISGDVLK